MTAQIITEFMDLRVKQIDAEKAKVAYAKKQQQLADGYRTTKKRK